MGRSSSSRRVSWTLSSKPPRRMLQSASSSLDNSSLALESSALRRSSSSLAPLAKIRSLYLYATAIAAYLGDAIMVMFDSTAGLTYRGLVANDQLVALLECKVFMRLSKYGIRSLWGNS